MKKFAIGLGILLVIFLTSAGAYLHYLSSSKNDPAFFESAIVAFEASDRESMPAPGGIVFVGSSSIRFWSTLAEDMAPLAVLNRGFGGAHFVHVNHNAARIVLPYSPRAVVVYAGDNDIGAGTMIADVVGGFTKFVALMHAELPETEIYYLPIKPSKLRWKLWDSMSRANGEIMAITQTDARLHYLDVATPLLNSNREPRDDVFLLDGLHMNETGYAEWTAVVRPVLIDAWAESATSPAGG